jgi:hypothetical protein
MVHDDCHPDVSLSEWQAFRDWHSPASASSGAPHCRAIDTVVDRSAIRLPSWYLPLARGAAIPSLYSLCRAGYRPGGHRARGWRKPRRSGNREEVFKDLGRDCLVVNRCKPFWRITMDRGVLSRPHPNFALVHRFGSTPILTRTYQEATYLAERCYETGWPGLCWVRECPDDMNDAIDFALDRRIAETRAAHRSSVAYAQSS